MKSTEPYTLKFLAHKRSIGDKLADEFIARTFQSATAKQELYSYFKELIYNEQLGKLPEAYRNEPVFIQTSRLPDWANSKLLQQGVTFFARHAALIMNMLGLLSLPYCYAAADGARVLHLSQRMLTDTGKRLQETGEFVWDVMAPNAFLPGGKGLVSVLKVRLMHAAVRYYTFQSNKWDNNRGCPVNQEDMAGTNLSFSLIVIRGLRKLDVAVSYNDQQAFMHLWNVIGYMSGIEEALLPENGKQAFDLEYLIRQTQFKSSEQGKALTHALVKYFGTVSLNTAFSPADTIQLMRYLLGNDVADLLELPPGTASSAVINLLKIAGTIQELKMQPSVHRAYASQYADFRKQQAEISNPVINKKVL